MRARLVSAVLGVACRLTGCAATLLLVRFALGRGVESPAALAVLQITLAGVIAVLIGNILEEVAFALSKQLMNWLGQPFARMTRTLRGRVISETYFPDGTWVRRETWKAGVVWEWTERDGSCARIETPAMRVMRTIPLPIQWIAERSITDRPCVPMPKSAGAFRYLWNSATRSRLQPSCGAAQARASRMLRKS